MEQLISTDLKIKNFLASSNQIIEGESVSFSWEVENADKVLLDDIEVVHHGNKSLQITLDKRVKLEAKKRGWFNKNTAEYIDITLAQPELILDFAEEIIYLREDETPVIFCTLINVSKFELILTKKGSVDIQTEILLSQSNSLKEKVWKQKVPLNLQKEADIAIRVYNGSRVKISDTILLRIKKPIIVDFSADKTLITPGTEVCIRWEIENAKKIEIDNGIGDVTGSYQYHFIATANQTFRITVKATSYFNEVTEQTITIYVARFIHFFASNNADYHEPLFYLNWDSEYFDTVTLYPNNVIVPSRCSLYSISSGNPPNAYKLSGILNGNTCELELPIPIAKIHSFRLEEQGAILNTEAHLKWEIENNQSISLDPLLDNSPDTNGTSFYVTDHIKRITLIVWGKANVALREIEIKKLKAPRIVAVTVPQPSFHYTLAVPEIPVSLVPFIYKISSTRTRFFSRQNLFKQPPKNRLHLIALLSNLLLTNAKRVSINKMAKKKLKTSASRVFYNIKNVIDNYNKT